MKQLLILIILTITFGIIDTYSSEPCSDSLFLELKKRNLMELSEREYDYLMLFQKNCLENGNKENTASGASNKVTCTLSVYIVPFKGPTDYDNQDIPSNSIFIDNHFVGDGAKTVFIEPGEHTVSLYSNTELKLGGKDAVSMSIRNEVNIISDFSIPNWSDEQSDERKLERKRKTLLMLNLKPNTQRKIIYTIKCNYQRDCEDDEWFYEIK